MVAHPTKLYIRCMLLVALLPGLSKCMPAGSGDGDQNWIMLHAALAQAAPDQFSELKLWLKADSLTSGHNIPINTWQDSSGNSNQAMQGIMTQQPLFKVSALAGKAALLFDGVDDFMELTDIDIDTMTIIIVAKPTRPNPGADYKVALFSNHNNNPNKSIRLQYRWTPKGNFRYGLIASTDGSTQFAATTFITNDSWHLNAVLYDGNYAYLYTSGNLRGTSTPNPGTIHNTTSIFYLGRNANAAPERFQGLVAEIIMYTRSLTETERSRIECHLSLKYQLYVPHLCY